MRGGIVTDSTVQLSNCCVTALDYNQNDNMHGIFRVKVVNDIESLYIQSPNSQENLFPDIKNRVT